MIDTKTGAFAALVSLGITVAMIWHGYETGPADTIKFYFLAYIAMKVQGEQA